MSKCLLNPQIKNISGRVGNILFKTYTKPDGTKETRAYGLPRRENGKYGYERTAKLSANEKAARMQFGMITKLVHDMPEEERMTYYRAWKKAKFMFNGKKYATLRGYIIARKYAEINAVEKAH